MNIKELEQAVEQAEQERIRIEWIVRDLEDELRKAEDELFAVEAEYETLIEELYLGHEKEIAERGVSA